MNSMGGYTRKYAYIYATQSLSLLLGLLSLFVVTPYLSSNHDLFGIYSICVSLTIFYSYADLGFVSSGLKFAAEAYIKNDFAKELKIVGFTGFVLLLFLAFISFIIFYLSFNPDLIIKNVTDEELLIAQKMLFVLAFSSPIYGLQRMIQIVYSVRLSDYYFQVFNIVGSLLKVLSVFYFFGGGNYDIFGYYLFFQLISLIVCICQYIFARIKFSLEMLELSKNVKFDNTVFFELKDLAFAGFFVSICWILYFEIDNLAISFLWGAKIVAIYAIAFNVLSLIRSFFGIIYSPFNARFNYFVGMNDIKGLNNYFQFIVNFFLPVTIVPLIVISLAAKPFVYSWVGDSYNISSDIVPLFSLSILFTFLTTPAGIYLTALKKINILYKNSVLIVIVYWVGIFILKDLLAFFSFGIMKATAFIISAVYLSIISCRLLNLSLMKLMWGLLKLYFVPTVICVMMTFVTVPFMRMEQGKYPLLINILIIIILIVMSMAVYLILCKDYRKMCLEVKRSFN